MPLNQQLSIHELTASIKRVNDIYYSLDGNSIFYLITTDGRGELFVRTETGEGEKLSRNLNVRGTVGYGGGDFDISEHLAVISEKEGDIFKINWETDRKITQITSLNARTSSPKISPDEKLVMYVYSRDEVNGIGITPTNGLTRLKQLITGSDFYMHPTWHPGGKRIAWAEWNHPYMPWDASRIKVGYVSGRQLKIIKEDYIDGNLNESANQPQFSPDGKWLSYIKRNGNWDDLVLYNLDTHAKKSIVKGDGFHLRMPDWIQGLHSYQWTSDSSTIYFIKYHQGTASLSKVCIHTSRLEPIDISPYAWASQIAVSKASDEVMFIGSSKREANQIVRISNGKILPSLLKNNHKQNIVPESQEISFFTEDGSTVYAWYFPPFKQKKRGCLPPCILNIHSGPTSVKHSGFSSDTAFFTSRGFAVVYLNYRGSATFGYDYQYALRRKWGEVEVQDAFYLINSLIKRKLVNPKKIVAMGSSAGGFSVLNLLIKFPGVFKAGICSYAVSDLVDDAQHTHKFERFYHQFLTGDFLTEYDCFINRSPISHLQEIKDAIALFHGTEDKVVSPNQSKEIFKSLANRNIPCILRLYEGEGHGFRKQKNIEDYYNTIIKFLDEVL
ncbi:MAG: S9 family peptidase [Anaerolineaceae bacterium]|nr:S9 family peptidase [Anaerolineaceae bacterium]